MKSLVILRGAVHTSSRLRRHSVVSLAEDALRRFGADDWEDTVLVKNLYDIFLGHKAGPSGVGAPNKRDEEKRVEAKGKEKGRRGKRKGGEMARREGKRRERRGEDLDACERGEGIW